MTATKWIMKNAAPFRLNIIALSAFNFISAIISVLYAVCFRSIIDYAIDVNITAAAKSALFLIGIVLIHIIIGFSANYIDELTRTKLGIHLRRKILSELLGKEYKDISSYHTGEINNRIFSDISVVTGHTVTIIPSAINMVVRLFAAFAVMFYINMYLSMIFLIVGAIAGACMIIFRRKMKQLHKDMQKQEGRVRSSIQETLSGALLIKIFNARNKRISELDERHADYKSAVMRRRVYSSLASAGMNLAYNAGFIFSFLWCVVGIINGFISYGSLTAVLQLTGQIQGSVSDITGIIPAFYSMTASAERLMELENLHDEDDTPSKISDISEISIQNVSFSYGREPVLKNVSLTVKKGETTAILGVSGAGKSTLFMLILGIYKPDSGRILMCAPDGTAEDAGFTMRRMFSYVPQDNQMFSGTVRENLTMAAEADDTKIMHATQIACADFVKTLPDGLDTVIGENGFGLSEGQRQRLAIARAVLSDAPVILFDEATSALDEETETRLIHNLEKIDKTSILITHRRSVLSICGSAYIMEDGELKKEI